MTCIRVATPADLPAILAIYAPYIKETTFTFEYEVPTVEEFRRRIAHTLEGYPYLVCEEAGVVLGYAYAHRMKERAAYGWNAELSVYLSEAAARRGIGRALYAALMDITQLQGVRNVYGVITGENERSIRFHEALGFTVAGVHHQTGYKNGRWLDVVDMEKRLSGDDPPSPLRPFSSLEEEVVAQILRRHEQEIR